MKTLRLVLALSLTPTLGAFGSAGSGPWANATYFPGNLDGKYQAAVTGANTAGVLGFALSDGAAPFRTATAGGGAGAATTSTTAVDSSLNYYAIFVNGKTYTGTTWASVNYNNNKVTGTLQGSAATTSTNLSLALSTQLFTNISTTNLPNVSNSVTSQFVTNITTTNFSSNVITSQLFTNTTYTNQTILVTNNGVVTETNIFFTNTTIETVFITNSVQIPTLLTNVTQNLITNAVNLAPTSVTLTNVSTAVLTNQQINTLVISTGVDGAFQANIKSKTGVFTFKGTGELTAPGPVISNTQTNPTLSFDVNGIRVSFSSTSRTATTATTAGTGTGR